MNIIKGLIRGIDWLSTMTAKVIIWLVMVLTLIICYEIFSRYLLNQPTKWSFDLSYMIGGTFFLMGEAWALQQKKHVRIDILYNRFSRKTQAAIDILLYLILFFPLWGGLLYVLIPYVAFSWEIGEKSMQGYWQPLIYPFKTVMPIGVGLLLLQGCAEVMKNIAVLAGQEVTK